MLVLDMDDFLPLRDVVFKALRQAILKGELLPGERLLEVQLAKKLGVSRTPVREAIRMLELEGLVSMVPRRGAEVAAISEKNLRDVLEVREALEELAIVLACERMSDEELLELEKALDNFNKALATGEPMKIAEADEAYHDIIFKSTGNDKLMLLVGNLREHMYRFRLEYIKDANHRERLSMEHDNMLKAIKSRNINEAKKYIREHIVNQKHIVAENIKLLKETEGQDD